MILLTILGYGAVLTCLILGLRMRVLYRKPVVGGCASCGYNLAGLPERGSLRCPECGAEGRAIRGGLTRKEQLRGAALIFTGVVGLILGLFSHSPDSPLVRALPTPTLVAMRFTWLDPFGVLKAELAMRSLTPTQRAVLIVRALRHLETWDYPRTGRDQRLWFLTHHARGREVFAEARKRGWSQERLGIALAERSLDSEYMFWMQGTRLVFDGSFEFPPGLVMTLAGIRASDPMTRQQAFINGAASMSRSGPYESLSVPLYRWRRTPELLQRVETRPPPRIDPPFIISDAVDGDPTFATAIAAWMQSKDPVVQSFAIMASWRFKGKVPPELLRSLLALSAAQSDDIAHLASNSALVFASRESSDEWRAVTRTFADDPTRPEVARAFAESLLDPAR